MVCFYGVVLFWVFKFVIIKGVLCGCFSGFCLLGYIVVCLGFVVFFVVGWWCVGVIEVVWLCVVVVYGDGLRGFMVVNAYMSLPELM